MSTVDSTTRTKPVEAPINRDVDGTAIGVALFLSESQLEALDIDPENQDEVTYWVEDGVIHVSPENRSSLENHE